MFNAGYIAVVGLRRKHSKIKFKKEFENSGIEFEISQDCSFLSYPFLPLPIHSTPPTPPPGDGGEVNPSPSKPPKPKSEILEPEKFDAFWKAYPRHVNKSGAVKKWNFTLGTGETDSDQLIAAAENYAAVVKGKEDRFILHPATFLGPDRRWNDFLQAPEPPPRSPELLAYDERMEKLDAEVRAEQAKRKVLGITYGYPKQT
jgi:hypothetical protein